MKEGIVMVCADGGIGRNLGRKNPCFPVNSRKKCPGNKSSCRFKRNSVKSLKA
jgi:hypothetical protein